MRASLKRFFIGGMCLVVILLSLAMRAREKKDTWAIGSEVNEQGFLREKVVANETEVALSRTGLENDLELIDQLNHVSKQSTDSSTETRSDGLVTEDSVQEAEINSVLSWQNVTETSEPATDLVKHEVGQLVDVTSNEDESSLTDVEQLRPSPLDHLTRSEVLNKSKVVDHIYIVNIPRCVSRWRWVQSVAESMGLDILRWEATAWQDIDFERPPLPLEVDWKAQNANRLKAGELGCLWSHVRLWRHAYENNYQRIMIFEDDVFLNETALPLLEGMFRDADLGAQKRNQSWHYMYLRRWPLQYVGDEEVWLEGQTSGRVLTIAHPSWGTAAYALSRAGIEWLVNTVTVYQRPLDVQLAKFQSDFPLTKFVALSACDRDHFQVLCPENVQIIPDSMQGECGGSMSQSGGSLEGPPLTRRLLRFVRRLRGLDSSWEARPRRRQ